MKLDWGNWAYGLVAAVLGGGAGSVVSALGTAIVIPGSMGLSGDAGWNTLKLMGITFLIHGGIALFLYLKQSPLPAKVTEVSETKTVTVTETPKPGA
jgi:hypothetical protein